MTTNPAHPALTMQIAGQDYRVDYQGRIVSPGKFEGEAAYVPYLWDAVMNGDGNIVPEALDVVEIDLTDDDWQAWPDLEGFKAAYLLEDGNGFVHCTLERG